MIRNSLLVGLFYLFFFQPLFAQDARELVRKADARYNGETSSYSEMSMTIVRPTYQRTLAFKSWATREGDALTLITAPARERGKVFSRAATTSGTGTPRSNG